ncbi:MAG TPA: nucleotide exchange factor GrpE, partial [Candidatus Dormibacteraeota bacterium]|nr:nucleotide exchange factor GrpE [Candidatus Dormibacteraeota bacterium]
MKDRESKLKVSEGEDAGQAAEEKTVVEDAAREESDVKKLAAELEDLRQTLLRRQADFDNYRKRIERERGEDGRRATARVIEGL